MARPARTVRPVEKTISIPEDIVTRIDLELFSELEGKVPFGKWAELVTNLLREHLDRQRAVNQLATGIVCLPHRMDLRDDPEGIRHVALNLLFEELVRLGYTPVVNAFRNLPRSTK